ncbi:MAG: antibiotic biosynthesis monooxygenase [Verrucomicrobiota bacterium]
MSKRAVLIATARVHPGEEQAFAAWQARHSSVISKQPGFISTDMIPPPGEKPGEPWTIIVTFESGQTLTAWQRSPERGAILGEVVPMLAGGDFGETISTDGTGTVPGADVTEVIFSKVKPGMADHYRDWASRIQTAQAKYPGYRGMYLQPPAGGKGGHWTSILRYDTTEHLEAWMNAPERKELLTETREFIESEEFMRIATAFPGWVPLDPMTGEGPPNWKAAMLVLLGLFPIVMIEMRFLSPILADLGIHASLGTFIGNAISVALTSFFTMPWCVSWFGWWLFPKGPEAAQLTARGVGILCVLFAIEVVVLWKLLPW